jgi:hypothetical protein
MISQVGAVVSVLNSILPVAQPSSSQNSMTQFPSPSKASVQVNINLNSVSNVQVAPVHDRIVHVIVSHRPYHVTPNMLLHVILAITLVQVSTQILCVVLVSLNAKLFHV